MSQEIVYDVRELAHEGKPSKQLKQVRSKAPLVRGQTLQLNIDHHTGHYEIVDIFNRERLSDDEIPLVEQTLLVRERPADYFRPW